MPTHAPVTGTPAPTIRTEQASSVAPHTMQAEGQLVMHNTTCPLDDDEFENALAFALANVTRAINVTTVFGYCFANNTAANYTLTLPINETDKYESSLAALSSSVATELRSLGFNTTGVEMLVAALLFNPVDGVECKLKVNDSECQHGQLLQSHQVVTPAKFGGNCTIPEAVILPCNSTSSSSSSDLSARQITGIVIGSVVGFCILLFCCFFLGRQCRRPRSSRKDPAIGNTPQSVAVRA